MNKFDINEAFIQALQEEQQKDVNGKKVEEDKKEEVLDVSKDTYWEGKGKYKELTDKINAKLLPSSGTDAKVQGIIPDNLFKQYVELQNKYYRFYNDGELPFRKTSAGWNATKSALDYDLKHQFDNNIDKPVLAQVGSDLENKMNGLISKILKVVPDLETKLDNIDKDDKITPKEKEENKEVTNNTESLTEADDTTADVNDDTTDTADSGRETVKDLNTDLFSIINMCQYGIGEGVVCTREQMDEVMIELAEPILTKAFQSVLPSATIKIGEFSHPKYYRAFTNLNDTLNFDVSFDAEEYKYVKTKTMKTDSFYLFLKDAYSSYDGFASFMADNKEDFEKQEPWKQFVQIIEFNLPMDYREYACSKDFLSSVEGALYSDFDSEMGIYDYAIEDMPRDVQDVEAWIRENFNVPENYDLEYVVSEIKDYIKENETDTEEPKEESKQIVTEGNKIPRDWKKITYKSKIDTSMCKVDDVIEVERDEFDRPIATNTTNGETAYANWDIIRNENCAEILSVDKKQTKKTEDIVDDEDDETDEDEDLYGETISLLAIAYRNIPENDVEEYGKDNELRFLLDTRKILSDLEYYEVEIPKKLYDDASPDDWSNGVDDYLDMMLGIDANSGKTYNTYNDMARLTHHLEYVVYKNSDECYIKMSVHRTGDVRGNYTEDFLLRFDSEEDFNECLLQSQDDNANTFEYEGKTYTVIPSIYSQFVDINCDDTNQSWRDVTCEDMDEFAEIIKTESDE